MTSPFNIEQSTKELLDGQSHVWHQIFNFISSMSLKCATELGIPDIIHAHGRPMTIVELVEALKINDTKADEFYRLMRVLTHSGFFTKEENGYSLTPSSILLVKTHPFNLRPFVLSMLDPILLNPWQHLSKWFQNEDPTPFETASGMPFWKKTEGDTIFSNLFDAGMASDTPLLSSTITRDHRQLFEGLDSIVDVGGGTGTLAKAIADTFPHIHCTVLDLPHVVAGLKGTRNLEFVGGDMFEHIPAADAIVMKWILHGWSDQKAIEILKRCKEAITSKGKIGVKVIIIDMSVDDDDRMKSPNINGNSNYETQLFFDLLVMTVNRGKERNKNEWAKLFLDAGFTHYKITPLSAIRSILEVYP